MKRESVELLRKIRELHAETHVTLNKLRDFANQCGSEEEGVDLAYAMNEAYKWTDEMRKQFKHLHEIAERVTCVILITKSTGASVKTEYCSATPKVKQIATIPKKSTQPEQYAALMTFLGVKPELWNKEDEDEVLRPHWPGLVAYLSDLQARGMPLPPGIDPDKTYPVYSLLIRPRKGVLSTD